MNHSRKTYLFVFKALFVILVTAGLSACGTTRFDRGVSGAGIGAGTGAVVGALTGLSIGQAALIGAGTGAVAGLITRPDEVNLGAPAWHNRTVRHRRRHY